MAKHLDLEEQEQLDQLKSFWKQYGNLITWLLIAALAAYAALNGWKWWQGRQAVTAAAMYEELDRAAAAGDAAKVARVFGDMKERVAGTAYAEQAGLLAARLHHEKGEADAARAALEWVAEHAVEDEYKTVARLRLAGLLLDQKKHDEALKLLDAATAKPFEALVADRRGDVLISQGKPDDAKAAYLKAWQGMDAANEYRRVVEAKLVALGAAPQAPKAAGGTR
jgi:predicted negative regulator of RcsB-dependent stress response